VSYPLSVGDPDGYGSFAELDDDGHTVGCHECGRRSRNLGLHVRVHAMTAAEYRQAHGLSTGQALIPADLARELAEHSRNSSTSLAALAANRDPDRARAANTTEGRSRPQRRAVRRRTAATARLGRQLTVAETTQLTRASWHRAIIARVAQEVPGLPIRYAGGLVTPAGQRRVLDCPGQQRPHIVRHQPGTDDARGAPTASTAKPALIPDAAADARVGSIRHPQRGGGRLEGDAGCGHHRCRRGRSTEPSGPPTGAFRLALTPGTAPRPPVR